MQDDHCGCEELACCKRWQGFGERQVGEGQVVEVWSQDEGEQEVDEEGARVFDQENCCPAQLRTCIPSISIILTIDDSQIG